MFDERFGCSCSDFEDAVEYNADFYCIKHGFYSERIVYLIDQIIDMAVEEERARYEQLLTCDISKSDFIGNGRKIWELREGSNRGIEPCLECGNARLIREALTPTKTSKQKNCIECGEIVGDIEWHYR